MSRRPGWDDFWFMLALAYSTRGTCDRLRTACLIVKNKRLVGAGYNGSPNKQPHCDDVGHLMIDNHCERTLHGEENAIINTNKRDLFQATAYIIGTPCYRCTKLLVNSGVKQIKYLGQYSNSRGKQYIKKLTQTAGVKLIQSKLKPQDLFDQTIERLKVSGGALYLPR